MAEISVIDLPLMAYSELTPNDRVLVIDDGSLKQFTWENLLNFIQANVQGEKGDQGVAGRDGRDGLNGTNGTNGANGLSAYQVAVNNGFVGTPTDWLNSIKGTAGVNGSNGTNGWTPILAIASDGDRRVIQVTSWVGGTGAAPITGYYGSTGIVANIAQAVDIRGIQGVAGLQGTKGDKGDKGDQGLQGATGLSAYQIALLEGFDGDEAEWLLSIQGTDGISAYQVAVNNGFVGTEAEWLLSLKGADGDPADVLTTVLTGLDSVTATGAITSTDTVLDAFAKVKATLATLTAPPNYGSVTDIGGEGYYPYAQSDGTLYTTTQDITIPAGFYRIIACAGYAVDTSDSYLTDIYRNLTGERLLYASGDGVSTGGTLYYEAAFAITSPENPLGNRGWRDDTIGSGDLLKHLFSGAQDIAKGAEGISGNNGTASGTIVMSEIVHFTEPTLLNLRVGVHKTMSTVDMATAGTGFIWIREVTP